jgi:hypothetical protein
MLKARHSPKVSAQVEASKPAPQTVCLAVVALREGGNNQWNRSGLRLCRSPHSLAKVGRLRRAEVSRPRITRHGGQVADNTLSVVPYNASTV